jgi:hypothetical protein
MMTIGDCVIMDLNMFYKLIKPYASKSNI